MKEEIKKSKSCAAKFIEGCDTNSSKFAKSLNPIFNNKRKNMKVPFLEHLENHQIGDIIKQHFTNICSHFQPINNEEMPSFLPSKQAPTIDKISVYKAILSIKTSKTSPPGTLPKQLIREFAYELSIPLTHIFNVCLKNGIFPDSWKRATISPIPKKKIMTDLGDLRPVSLTPDFGKVLEGFVTQWTGRYFA